VAAAELATPALLQKIPGRNSSGTPIGHESTASAAVCLQLHQHFDGDAVHLAVITVVVSLLQELTAA
jgi:hypothetical protein